MVISWQVKAVLALLACLAIGGLGWFAYHEIGARAVDKTVIKQAENTIVNQDHTIVQAASSAAITGDVVASEAQAVQTNHDAMTTIGSSADSQINTIHTNTGKQPVIHSATGTVPASAPSVDQQVSQVQITSIWQAYCVAKPSDPACAQIPKP